MLAGERQTKNIFILATLYKSSPLLMVFLIILFLLYFTLLLWIILPSLPIHSSQFSVYYFSFNNVSPSCSATFLNLDTEEKNKIKREERQAVFPTAFAGKTPRGKFYFLYLSTMLLGAVT
jgi:hypothetical protein